MHVQYLGIDAASAFSQRIRPDGQNGPDDGFRVVRADTDAVADKNSSLICRHILRGNDDVPVRANPGRYAIDRRISAGNAQKSLAVGCGTLHHFAAKPYPYVLTGCPDDILHGQLLAV